MSKESEVSCRLIYALAGERQCFNLRGPRVLLGRSPRCHLLIPSSLGKISREHAELVADDNGWTIRDLGSHNGVFVHGVQVSSRLLRDGDAFSIGGLDFRFEAMRGGSFPDACEVFFTEASIEGLEREVIDMTAFDRLLTVESLAKEEEAAAVPAHPATKGRRSAPGRATTRLAGSSSIIQLLREAAEFLLEGHSLERTLRRFLELVVRSLGARRGFIGLVEAATGEVVPFATVLANEEPAGPFAISRHVVDAAIRSRQAMLVHDVSSDTRFKQAESILTTHIRSLMCAPLYRKGQVGGLLYVDNPGEPQSFNATSLQALSVLATLAAVAVEGTQLREAMARDQKVRDRLARYSAASVVEEIVGRQRSLDDAESSLSADEREVSVLFCDLAGFTAFAESRAPSEVASMLNAAFESLCCAVFAEGGTLDKFTGDGMLVFFGAPIAQPDHAERAVRAALRMQQSMIDEFLRNPQLPALKLRVGINSGRAIVGDIGTRSRREYTVIGDVVNVASRLESAVAQPGQVVIGPATRELVKDRFRCEPLAEQRLRGKQRLVTPFVVLGPSEEAGALPRSHSANTQGHRAPPAKELGE